MENVYHIFVKGLQEKYINRFQDSKEDVAFKSTVVAKKTLLAGFTTVRDVVGSGVNIALRNAINRGIVDGPRIFTSGKTIATTGDICRRGGLEWFSKFGREKNRRIEIEINF